MSEYVLHCRGCGYGLQAYFGTCVLYPGDYRKIVRAVRLGVYGASARKSLKETPMGVLDCDRVLLQCKGMRKVGYRAGFVSIWPEGTCSEGNSKGAAVRSVRRCCLRGSLEPERIYVVPSDGTRMLQMRRRDENYPGG